MPSSGVPSSAAVGRTLAAFDDHAAGHDRRAALTQGAHMIASASASVSSSAHGAGVAACGHAGRRAGRGACSVNGERTFR